MERGSQKLRRFITVIAAMGLFATGGCKTTLRGGEEFMVQPVEPSTLLDDFLGSSLSGLWGHSWNPTSAYPTLSSRIGVQSGKLQFQFYSTDAAWTYSPGIHSVNTYNLTDRWVQFDISNDHDPSLLSWDVGVALYDNDAVGVYSYLGVMYVYHRKNGNSTSVMGASTPLPSGSLFVRVRHQSSNDSYVIEYSQNLGSWTAIDSVPAWSAMPVSGVHFYMGAWGDAVPTDSVVTYGSVYSNAVQN